MYNKIFTKILDSSIWLEPDATRIVWLTCIAAMDEDGFCQFASIANLAHRANVSLEAAQRAVQTLEQPDENSSDPEHEGRRIERVPGGWVVLNAAKYRELVTRTVSQERTRQRVERYRKRRSGNALVTVANGAVTAANVPVTQSEAYTDTEARSEAVAVAGTAAATTTKPQLKPRPQQFGRITLHRWMLDQIIRNLGPHAESFDLDVWLDSLSGKADAQGVTFPTTSDVWPWVQAELKAECQRRGLAVASGETTSQLGKQSTRLLTALQNIARTEGEA
jgi:hypothetical protein